MDRKLIAMIALVLPALTMAEEPFPPITDAQREMAKTMVTVVAAGVVVPAATLLLVGEVFDAACTGAGFEFRMNEDYDGSGSLWYCTGLPRRE